MVKSDTWDPAATAGVRPVADPQPSRRVLLFMPQTGHPWRGSFRADLDSDWVPDSTHCSRGRCGFHSVSTRECQNAVFSRRGDVMSERGTSYILAGGAAELERLRLQARVWEPETGTCRRRYDMGIGDDECFAQKSRNWRASPVSTPHRARSSTAPASLAMGSFQ